MVDDHDLTGCEPHAIMEWGKAEQLPVLEGKKMLMLISPRKK